MPCHGTVAGENGLLVKRPKKERQRYLFVWAFFMMACLCGVILILFVRKLTPLETILSLSIIIFLSGVVGGYCLGEVGKQTFLINQKGITRLRYGKPWKHFNWDTFVTIEKHIVYRELHYSREEYEAILCSTHPIEIKVQRNGERYLTSEYHRQKSNKKTVVELVLEKDQYVEFLSYIPEEIKELGIVKI